MASKKPALFAKAAKPPVVVVEFQNADLVIYVTAIQSEFCSGNTVPWHLELGKLP